MKKVLILSLAALIFASCSNDASQTNVNAPRANTNAPASATRTADNTLVVSSHSTNKTADANLKQNPNSADQSQTTSPMQKPIDVSEMTTKIEKADKDFKAKPADEKAKKALADAYFERAFALTEAAQYRAALGDFRKGLKLAPDNKEAQSMHDEIIAIFKSIGREPPKEGEEPPPAPLTKP